MKTFLLGTTALVGAALLAGAAQAESPKVTVGGFADFQAGFIDEDLDNGRGSYEMQNDTEIHVSVDGKSDSGLGYGAVIELEADVDGDADGQGGNADRTYVYLEGGWGRFELGSNIGAAGTMKVDASTFARATGGIDGDFYDFVNPASFAPGFIVRPDLLLDHGSLTTGAAGGMEDQTKITYYSPRFSGFQLGASFIPDTGDVGQGGPANAFSGDTNGDLENVFSLGINYTGQFDAVSVAASLTGEFGDSEIAGAGDYDAVALGLNLGYMGFSFGGSYGDTEVGGLDADYWTLGAAYDFGAFGTSLTYLDSEVEVGGGADNEFQNISLGVDYMLAPGLVPYVEVSFFEFDQAGIAGIENDGTVLLIGTELSF